MDRQSPMAKTILVTGGFGFLGRAVASGFKRRGYRVVGVGRGHWAPEEAHARGFDQWLNAGVNLSSLMTLQESFELIVHCAGNGSVSYSLTNPLQDFHKTVQSTADLLEYMRLTQPTALLIYPSSAGVYGAKPDAPIHEDDLPNPISPYGHHKKIAEELLWSYAHSYGVRVAIIRFFSIYGPGLTKQLLWDASAKLREARNGTAVFWGTGEETRDWISSDEAVDLIHAVSRSTSPFTLVNGASGVKTTVRDTLGLLRESLGAEAKISFNNLVRAGDPRYYHANIGKALALGWKPSMPLQQGVEAYVRWLISYQEHRLD